MSDLLELERQVLALSEPDLNAFAEWFANLQADAWDAQIERDIRQGKWNNEFSAALAEHAEGKTTPL